MTEIPSYQPSTYYFRLELENARTKREAVALGRHLCRELEELKAWVRERGLVPPKWHITRSESEAKNWGEVVTLPTSD